MTIISTIKGYVGKTISLFVRAYYSYMNSTVRKKLGSDVVIQYPYHISGINNIICSGPVNIGINSILMSTRAKIIIKGHFVSGPHLTIITGDHMPIIGRYIDTVTDNEKDSLDITKEYDKDVVIEEDVWAGANVTILKGVVIGKGSIIAAGAVVTKSMPPYSIIGGVPSKVIKSRWTNEQINAHEKILY